MKTSVALKSLGLVIMLLVYNLL